MPNYQHTCPECGYTTETFYSMSDVDLSLDQLVEKYPDLKQQITCPTLNCVNNGKIVGRQIFAPALTGFVHGMSVGEKGVLAKKQQQKKKRSKDHFKKEVLPNLDKKEQQRFTQKYKKQGE